MNITIPIADKVLTVAEWGTFAPSSSEYRFPIMFKITDGAGKLYYSAYGHIWINAVDMNALLATSAQKTEPAPNPGISELTLLRAIALVNDPQLIKDMT